MSGTRQSIKATMGRRACACLMLLLFFALTILSPLPQARAEESEAEAVAITNQCTITLPENEAGKEYRVLDGNVESYVSLDHSEYVEIALPESGAGYLSLLWFDVPEQYALEQLDASGANLRTDEGGVFLNACYALEADARTLRIALPREARLSDICVYTPGERPAELQCWEPTPDTVDLLLVASTPQAAAQDFYALLAAYTAAHEVSTKLVVMERDSRLAIEELLGALWGLGIDEYPLILGFACNNNDSYKLTKGEWNAGATTRALSDLLETSGARVLVTHAASETACSASSQFLGEIVDNALERITDETAERLLKVYHADPEGTTVLRIDEPLIALGGQTANEAATAAYREHVSLKLYGETYVPTTGFSLTQSRIGGDALGDNLLENIDVLSLTRYVEPTPTPTPTPEPTPTPAPTELPVETTAQPMPTATTHKEETTNDGAALLIRVLPIAIVVPGLVGCLCVGLFGFRKIAARFSTARALFMTILPLLISMMLLGVFLLVVKPKLARLAEQTKAESAVQASLAAAALATPEPTPTSEPIQTEAVVETVEDVQEEAEKADALDNPYGNNDGGVNDDQYYRAADDPEEVIVVDIEAGHWEYRTDTLSILIERTLVTEPKENAVFTAHIRMRGENAFRTLQAAENRNGMGALKPWIISRQGKAVLLITGDNLIESDDMYKGILIRDGIVFQDRRAVNTLAMYPDMTMRIYPENSVDAQDLLEDGVRDAISFGPTLIENGEINQKAAEHRLSRRNNPRTGLGQVEPGHFVAIVCDGRQEGYSLGMKLDEFAELFAKEGCSIAYNLDGGLSACMLFMGEQLNSHGNKKEGEITDTYQRRVPDGLVWGWSAQVPSVDDPIYNTGTGD